MNKEEIVDLLIKQRDLSYQLKFLYEQLCDKDRKKEIENEARLDFIECLLEKIG